MKHVSKKDKSMIAGQQAQGDILFTPVAEMPGDAKRLATQVVADGEATGHQHVLTGGELHRTDEGITFVVVPDLQDGEVAVVHPEHGTIVLSPGWYQVDYQIEADPFTGMARRVLD